MVTTFLEAAAGTVIVAAVMADVFATVLVPGPAFGGRGIAGWTKALVLPAWQHLSAVQGERRALSNVFAPSLFALAFVSWLLLLVGGFGLLFHAARDLFEPAIETFSQAAYVAGSSVLTLGVSEVDAQGLARWLILVAALCGFSVITASITFILQVQSALHQRETQVMTLSGMAGRPATALTLLETFAALELKEELPGFFRAWRDWSASLLHSHVASPVLGYFHSVDSENDWVTALSVVLDAATAINVLTDEPARGSAALMHRSGARTAAHLCNLYRLPSPDAVPVGEDTIERFASALEELGYSVRRENAAERFSKMRADYRGRLEALALHLGSSATDLMPAASLDHPR